MKNLLQQLKTISSAKALSIIGLSILVVLGVMIAKVQPQYLQASFFGRFFPKTEEPTTTEEDTDTKAEEPLGFYRFNDLQAQYFPIPTDIKQLTKAINYDYTPATFAPFQDSFVQLWEEWVGNKENPGTMIVSHQYTNQHDEQYDRIVATMQDTHQKKQTLAAELIMKVCKKQLSSELCE